MASSPRSTLAPRSGTVWSGAVNATARPWPHQPTKAFLFISGAHGSEVRLPDSGALQQWLGLLRDWGYESVRTNALSPAAAAAMEAVGFSTCQHLVLLSRMGATTRSAVASDLKPRRIRLGRTANLRRSANRQAIARVLVLDEMAFGREWCLDEISLLDAYKATQRAALLEVHDRSDQSRCLGFILVGRTGPAGFIQRLAVHPDVRRTGLASSLLAAGTQWLHRHGAEVMAVNTENINEAALALYERHGFDAMPYGLSVMERELT